MRHARWLWLGVLLSCSGGNDARDGTPAAAAGAIALPAAFDSVLRAYERAYAQHDAAAVAALFTDDGYLMQLSRPAVRGRAAIAAALGREGGPLRLVPIAYAMSDSAGYVIGTFGAERGPAEGGKFVLALRRTAGGPWRIAADIANPNGS